MDGDGLDIFLEPVATWFRRDVGIPTAVQREGWSSIARGQHTLLHAPTGSGKTLAGFLAGLDSLWRSPRDAAGVRILYVSPLKALNEDIARNLDRPLAGIRAVAEELGKALPEIRTAVRTGDTPQAERQRLVRKPPQVLITTPESLHILLTSRARETLRTVEYLLVDEVHALCPNKRGVFLSLLLERLEAIVRTPPIRIGMSATQRPLEMVARYLGGQRRVASETGGFRYEPRPVHIVDAGARRDLDLKVVYPAAEQESGPVWPAIEARLTEWIARHRSTIVFANNRRLVERLTARLNERFAENGQSIDSKPVTSESTRVIESAALVSAHHGSLSLDRRRATEVALKEGSLRAVVATSSLELGIDMGAVDLVCQVESPGQVGRALQRVGRAGHGVGLSSRGRLVAKTQADLLEMAALARAMREGRVEALHVPSNCLDLLAQQIVSAVAVESWSATDLYSLFRQSYPYRDLSAEAFELVVRLVSGRFQVAGMRDLRPRISWDPVHQKLHPLPGSARLAIVSGGAIPDTGAFPLQLGDDGPRLGELDEEFVLERRVGESFVLGSSIWRIETIEPHRVTVSPAAGREALVPFWRGEACHRSGDLGRQIGRLVRELRDRPSSDETLDWLEEEYGLERSSAARLQAFVLRQYRSSGVAPDDRTIVVEAYRDQTGERGIAVLSSFGGTFHHALRLVLISEIQARYGLEPASLHADEGILFRFPDVEEPPLDLLAGLTADRAEALLRAALPDSALFGLRFRQNAGRSFLMPRPEPGHRAPLWLQRLRSKDLLQFTRRIPDFPIVVETYRQCLDDDLDLPGLRKILQAIDSGEIQVATVDRETPSPFADSLMLPFTQKFLYEWDEPRRPANDSSKTAESKLLDSLLLRDVDDWLEPAAIEKVDGTARGAERQPRTLEEAFEYLRNRGDLLDSECAGPLCEQLTQLESDARVCRVEVADATEPGRWIPAEDLGVYTEAFSVDRVDSPRRIESQRAIVRRHLRSRALVSLDDLIRRYGLSSAEAREILEAECGDGMAAQLGDESSALWADHSNARELRRISLAIRRREAVAVPPEVFADFVARRQFLHPDAKKVPGDLEAVIDRLRGFGASIGSWESQLLPCRITAFQPSQLDALIDSGRWRVRSWKGESPERLLGWAPEDFDVQWPASREELGDDAVAVVASLRKFGARFADDLASELGWAPSRVRAILAELLNLGLVSADRLDPFRAGPDAIEPAPPRESQSVGTRRLGRPRPRRSTLRAPSRWSLFDDRSDDAEASALAWCDAILDRYGLVTRDLVALETLAPPWRELAPWLDRAEWRGDLRRGFFVEGLAGIQYALPETPAALLEGWRSRESGATPAPYLLWATDPASLYTSAGPFDVIELPGTGSRLTRASGSLTIQCDGRPIVIVESLGKRLRTLPSAPREALEVGLPLLTLLASSGRRVLKIEEIDGVAAASSSLASILLQAGFVRDFPGLAYYAGF